jgi:hypothetical protein
MDTDEGFGKCDEMGTGGECDGCEERAVHTEQGGDQTEHRLTPVETIKTQPIRVRVSDLDVLQQLKTSEDETPGDVINRVLAHPYIDNLNTIIANQAEEITALGQEIAKRDTFIGEQSVLLEDLRGEALLVELRDKHELDEPDDDELPPRGTYVKRGTTINIIIGG